MDFESKISTCSDEALLRELINRIKRIENSEKGFKFAEKIRALAHFCSDKGYYLKNVEKVNEEFYDKNTNI